MNGWEGEVHQFLFPKKVYSHRALSAQGRVKSLPAKMDVKRFAHHIFKCLQYSLLWIQRIECQGLPRCASSKEPACQCRRHKRQGFDPQVRKIPWRRAWQPTPVFLPGESHGQRSLVGYSPWGHKDPDNLAHSTLLSRVMLLALPYICVDINDEKHR